MRHTLLASAALLLAAASPAPAGPVRLQPMPGTPLEATAKQVATADIEDGGAGALLLLGSEPLGSAGTGPALFVQVQSPRACGSAGCSTSVYLPTRTGWVKVLDAVSGDVVVEPAQHRGMHDLLVGKNDRWVWNGRAYADTLPAPNVDLRPRKPVHHVTRTRSHAHP
jgi:hypothetical protein